LISNFVIGLDISTSCTGVSILSDSGEIINVVTHKPKGETLVEKALDFKAFMKDLLSLYGDHVLCGVYIEQNLQKFRRGFSSAQVINKLARYNGMCSLIMFELCNMQPHYINVNEGRKALGIKVPRGQNAKEVVHSWCQSKYTNFVWPVKVLKSGPRKGVEILDPKCYDMADALITALAGLRLFSNE
jgi:hypothetical protein